MQSRQCMRDGAEIVLGRVKVGLHEGSVSVRVVDDSSGDEWLLTWKKVRHSGSYCV